MSDFLLNSVGVKFIASLSSDYTKFISEYGIQYDYHIITWLIACKTSSKINIKVEFQSKAE